MAEQRVLAIDVGGTAAKYGYVSATGEITAQGRFATDDITLFSEFFDRLCAVVGAAYQEGIAEVGISCPGIFDVSGASIGNVENLPYLAGKNLPSLLRAQYENLSVQIGNDANAAAMGEYWHGAAKGSPCFVCVTLGTGIGGALVIDGKPHLGHHFQSCEIGYTNFQSQQDYYEKRYSTKGILKILAKALHVEKVSGRVFTQKVEENEPVYTQTFALWMDALGQMIANIMLVVDPERIVIGGGISREKALLLPALTAAIDAHLPKPFQNKSNLHMAQCGNDAGLLGAAQPFFERSI